MLDSLFFGVAVFFTSVLWCVCREKSELMNTVSKLRSTVTSLQQREQDALRQVRQSVEVAEQAQVERAQVNMTVRVATHSSD